MVRGGIAHLVFGERLARYGHTPRMRLMLFPRKRQEKGCYQKGGCREVSFCNHRSSICVCRVPCSVWDSQTSLCVKCSQLRVHRESRSKHLFLPWQFKSTCILGASESQLWKKSGSCFSGFSISWDDLWSIVICRLAGLAHRRDLIHHVMLPIEFAMTMTPTWSCLH